MMTRILEIKLSADTLALMGGRLMAKARSSRPDFNIKVLEAGLEDA
jgi:hypothetical protein